MKTAKEIPQALSQPQEGTGSGTLPTAAGCRETWIGDVLAVRATEADLQGGPGQVITGMAGLRPRGETKRTMRVFIRLGKPPEDVLETMGSVPMSPRGVPRAERRTREQVRSIHDVPDPRGCTRETPVTQGVQVTRRTLSVWRNGRLHPARTLRGRLRTRRDQLGRHGVLRADFHPHRVRDVLVEPTCRINQLFA
jgi:hypothetical protein